MTPATQKPTPSPRALRFNREARALAEAESLGVNLRDPFGMGWAESPIGPRGLTTPLIRPYTFGMPKTGRGPHATPQP